MSNGAMSNMHMRRCTMSTSCTTTLWPVRSIARTVPDVPVVVTHHGPFEEAERQLYRAADERITLVAISHHQASTARDVHVETVIHHGVDAKRFPVGRGNGGYFLFLGE